MCPNHLETHNVGYFEHMRGALNFFARCVLWSIEVLIHAFVPDLFTDTSARMKAEIKRREEER